MGASQRKEAAAYFHEVAVSAAPPSLEAFAEQLSLFGAGVCSGSEFFSLSRPIVAQLVAHNGTTRRVQWLLEYCCQVLQSATASPAGLGEGDAAALRLLELVLRHAHALTAGDSAALLALVEADAAGGAAPHQNCTTLCALLMRYTLQVKFDGASAVGHAAAMRLLLTLTSSALHHGTRYSAASADVFTEAIVASEALHPFMAVLLQRVVEWGSGDGAAAAGAPLYAEGCEPGIRNIFGLFGGGGRAAGTPLTPAANSAGGVVAADGRFTPTFFTAGNKGADASKNVFSSCPAGELVYRHSAALLAVLVAHQKGNGHNPALEYVRALQDASPVAFIRLLAALGNKITVFPSAGMVLYVLLYDHPSFLYSTLRADQSVLMGVVEKVLLLTHAACTQADPVPSSSSAGAGAGDGDGAATAAGVPVSILEDPLQLGDLGRIMGEATAYAAPFINFMTSTLLLVLSQDRVVNQLMCRHPCTMLAGLDRRHHSRDGRTTVAALAVQVLAVGIVKAVNERNEPLAAVFVPCLANMSVFLRGLDTYTSQRLVALLLVILRKITYVDRAYAAAEKGAADPAAAKAPPSHANPYAGEDIASLDALAAMLLRQLRTVAEAVEGMLRGSDRNNEALVYELLYESDKIVGRASAGAGAARHGGDGAVADSADPSASASTTAAEPPAGGRCAAQVRAALSNLVALITGYEAEIASAPSASSPKEIIAIIRGCAQGGGQSPQSQQLSPGAGGAAGVAGAGGGDAAVDLLYTYEESPHSYDFFGPFVWSTLLSDARWPGGVMWGTNTAELPLFPQ